MSKQFIKIIAIIFAVLAIIIAWPWLNKVINPQKTNSMDKVSVNLAQFTPETVTKISIKKGNEEKVLSFSNNQWLIGNDEAEMDKVKQLFQDMANLKIKEMVSENQDNWKKFEVTADTGFQLTITQNGQESVFFIGKSGTATDDFYIRKDGIKNVYLVNGGLRDKLGWEETKWKKAAESQNKK